MKIVKRFISMILATIMVFSVFSYELATVSAEGSALNGHGTSAAAEAATLTYYINYYIQGTTTSIKASVIQTGPYDGTYLDAVAPDVPGYLLTPFDSSPVRILLSASNNTVNFFYVAKIFTLIFQSNGGTAISSITQGYNTSILKPTDPLKANYKFSGWYTDAACTHLVSWPFHMPLNGGTLYAGWTQSPVTLTFNSNNGSTVSPITRTPGALVQKPSNPTRTWFRFDGWYYDISFVQPVSWPLVMPIDSLTLYAKWTYVRNTISYNVNGGTDVSQTTASTDAEVYPPDDPVKEGYTFAGWFYDDVTFVQAVQWPVIMPETGFTIYAKWSPNMMTITFDTQGGTEIDPLMEYAGFSITAPDPPSRFGYVFAGWSLDGEPYTFATMPTLDTTLVAAWTASTKYVQADLQAYKTVNNLLVPATKARAGDIITVRFTPKTNFYCGATRFIIMYDSSFYTIVGSNKTAITPNPGNTYYANTVSSYSGTTSSPVSQWPNTFVSGESSQYKFVAANFTSSFDSVNKGHPVIMDGGSWLFSIKLQVKPGATGSGHIFMDNRWDRSATNTTGGQYYYYCANDTMYSTAGNSVLDFDTNYVNTSRYVSFDSSIPVYSNIILDTAGGSPISTLNGEVGTALLPPADPVRDGYTFTGWSPAFPSTFPVSDITLVAQWQINTYNAYFYVDGVLTATVPTVYGEAIVPPASPTKTGNTFTGWSPAVGTMGAADITFNAVFTVNTYNAIFKVDGAVYKTVPTVYNTQIVAPTNPTKTGYTFTGWNPAVGVIGAADKTFNAIFSRNTYNAIFVVDGVTVATVPTLFGTQIVAPTPNPTKTGYTFTAWSPTVGIMGASNKTFNAVFSINSYNAVFKVDNVVYQTVSTVYNTQIIAPADPVKAGYTFTGWTPSVGIIGAGEMTFNATFTINTYNAIFKVDGVTIQTVPTVYGAQIVAPANPAKTGCTFTNWSPVVGTMGAGDITFNAIFSINSYTITFDANGGTGGGSNAMNYGAPLSAPTVTRTGYTFTGWSQSVPATVPAANTTFIAQWSINTYNAIFKVDGVIYQTIPTVYGAQIIAPADPAKTGYSFTGWSPAVGTMGAGDMVFTTTLSINTYIATFKVDGLTVQTVPTVYGAQIIAPANPVKTGYTFTGWSPAVGTMGAGDITFDAQFTIKQITITFNSNGGSAVSSLTGDYGSVVVKPADPTKAHYTFMGWSPAVPATYPEANITVTAQWTINRYTITFASNGGSSVAAITQDYNTTVAKPADPSRTFYTFAGWYSNAGLTTAVTWPYTIGGSDVTFYAKWNRVPVTLSAKAGSTTIIDQGNHFIYGLEEGMTSSVFTNNFIKVSGDGHIVITYNSDSFGTGTRIQLIDNVTGLVAATYYIVIFGDVDGDGYITAADENQIGMVAAYQTEFDAGSSFEYAADLTQDGIVDSFDLNIIRAATNYIGVIDQTNPGELI